MNDVVLEFNKAGGASFSPKETAGKKSQSRPVTTENKQASTPGTRKYVQTKSAPQASNTSV